MDGLGKQYPHREPGGKKFSPEPYNGKWGRVLPFNLQGCSPGTELLSLYDCIYYDKIHREVELYFSVQALCEFQSYQ